MMTKPDFQAAIAALTAKFAASLPEKRQILIDQAERWKTSRDPAALREAVAQAHKLAGSAGSYGFDPLGLAARHFEQCVRSWPDHLPPDTRAAEESDRLLEALIQLFP